MSRPVDPFIALSTGGKFYPLGPDPDRVDIRDVAHSLSQQCRFAGHTSEFWSVAAHSLEVSRRVEAILSRDPWYERYHPAWVDPQMLHGIPARVGALCALLHDASEAYLQDVVRPIKPLLQSYRLWEESVERAIAERFGLPHPWPPIVKVVDDAIVLDEVASFFPPGSAAWARYGITARHQVRLKPLAPLVAEKQFLQRFKQLTGE